MKVVGWALIGTDGIPAKETDVYKTKKSLLISYDMMPLRGLEKCESHLQSKGMMPRVVEIVVAKDTHCHGFAPTVNGTPDIDMMDYGAFGTPESMVFEATALYLSDAGVEGFCITNDERNTLNSFSFFEVVKVKGTTRKKAFENLKSKVGAILYRTKIVIDAVELKVQEGKK